MELYEITVFGIVKGQKIPFHSAVLKATNPMKAFAEAGVVVDQHHVCEIRHADTPEYEDAKERRSDL